MLGLRKSPPTAEPPPGAMSAPIRGPSYSPGFLKRQPIKQSIPQVAAGTVVDFDRGVAIKPTQLQALPPENSGFSMLFRGPIRNFYIRDWYWRAIWSMDDRSMPNAHVLPTLTPNPGSQPGGATMQSRPGLTRTLRTPAWTIEPPTRDAHSTAPGDQ